MSPPTFEDQTLDATDTLIIGEEPARRVILSINLVLAQKHHTYKLSPKIWEEVKVMPSEGAGKAFHNHPTTVKVKGDNHCYSYRIVWLLTQSQDQHFAFRQSLCDYVTDEQNLMHLQSYIQTECKNGSYYTDTMKFSNCSWNKEVMIFTKAQMTSKVIAMYINDYHVMTWY